jgi:hypothetical protein
MRRDNPWWGSTSSRARAQQGVEARHVIHHFVGKTFFPPKLETRAPKPVITSTHKNRKCKMASNNMPRFDAPNDRPIINNRKEEPDVTIIVGGKTFRHYRQVLCLASDFFDAALNSGMKESLTSTIEFPDKKPEEWELFASFLEPLSHTKVTESNVVMLTPWFHEFGASALLEECDRVYRDIILSDFGMFQEKSSRKFGKLSVPELETLRKEFQALADAYEFSVMYGLALTRKETIWGLKNIVLFQQDIFDLDCASRLVSLLHHEECRGHLWGSVMENFPHSIAEKVINKDPESLVSNELFAPLLLAVMNMSVEEIMRQSMSE